MRDQPADGLDFAGPLPEVLVVIPVKDDVEGLTATLDGLTGQDYLGSWSILVVDNGSEGLGIRHLCRDRDVRCLVEARPGSYAARNRAVSTLDSARVVAFTDADCRPEPSWLSAAVRPLVSGGCDVAAGRIRMIVPSQRPPTMAEAWEIVTAFRQEAYVHRSGWGVTANLVVTAAALREVGSFDEELRSGGDADWGRRATARGLRVRYIPGAVVWHPPRTSMRDLFTKLRRVQRGALQQAVKRGETLPGPFEIAMTFRPPLGAVRRAREHPDLRGRRAEVNYVLAEWLVRVVALWLRLSETRKVRSA